ncbi:aldo/keto reductase [Desulfobacterota bacterium AH_259_B03_O07]|nr:aldo/keto reductase [Desulfobacterota bacterium AH_259_B03_O07]
MNNYSTHEGTARYRDRFKDNLAQNHFNESQNLWFSSIGFGSYLGNHDDQTDSNYQNALKHAIGLGCNHIDTAINYRFQRSERAIGSALETAFNEGTVNRDELIIATKGGYIPFDSDPPKDTRKYFIETFVEPGIASPEDIIAGSHCLTPNYIKNQLECSLKNLGIDCIDIYYLHNPEEQLRELSRESFSKRVASAFELLETKVSDGKIKIYGTATWNGYRQEPTEAGYLSLEDFVLIAKEVAGENHNFKVIQLPFNLAMPEALTLRNQPLGGVMYSVFEAAHNLGFTVIASSSLLQSQLTRNLPDFINKYLKNLNSDAQRAIQFVRSIPEITTALIGMSSVKHVDENMKVAELPPASEDDIKKLFEKA